jgi:1,3-beta-glucanosyltransferase GAS3
VLADTWNYMQCTISGETADSRSEFFGLNSYSWCGASATYQSAGYDTLVAMFASTSIPVFFSEYGCNEPKGVPRVFNEVAALYGPNMTGLNGGLVYEYSQEPDDYGLVNISTADGSVTLLQDYVNLLGQFNKLDESLLTKAPSTTNTPPVCSTSLVTGASGLGNNFTIPDAPPGTADLIANGVTGAVSGKIVPVTSLDVTQKIFDVSGNPITGLSLNQISGSNVPSGKNLTSGSGSGSGGSSGGSGKKSAGVALRAPATVLVGLAVAIALFV